MMFLSRRKYSLLYIGILFGLVGFALPQAGFCQESGKGKIEDQIGDKLHDPVTHLRVGVVGTFSLFELVPEIPDLCRSVMKVSLHPLCEKDLPVVVLKPVVLGKLLRDPMKDAAFVDVLWKANSNPTNRMLDQTSKRILEYGVGVAPFIVISESIFAEDVRRDLTLAQEYGYFLFTNTPKGIKKFALPGGKEFSRLPSPKNLLRFDKEEATLWGVVPELFLPVKAQETLSHVIDSEATALLRKLSPLKELFAQTLPVRLLKIRDSFSSFSDYFCGYAITPISGFSEKRYALLTGHDPSDPEHCFERMPIIFQEIYYVLWEIGIRQPK